MAAPGTDIVLSDDRLLGARAFANKIWNAARFLFMNLEKFEQSGGAKLEELAAPEVRAAAPYSMAGKIPLADEWLFARLAGTIEAANKAWETYYFHEAAQQITNFSGAIFAIGTLNGLSLNCKALTPKEPLRLGRICLPRLMLH